MKYPDDFINKVICGDCLEVMKYIPDGAVDLVLTDPPYGVNIAEWDKEIPPLEWLDECRRISKSTFVTCGNGNQYEYPKPLWTGGWFRAGSIQRARHGQCFSHWEPILIYDYNFLSVDMKSFPPNQDVKGNNHPCPKPIKLMRWIVGEAKEDAIILDPFLGSGTTAVACKQLGRRYIGIEINPEYCKIAEQRLAQEELF